MNLPLGVSLQNVEMDSLSSLFDCAGAVSGFPRAEAPAPFPGAYSHEKEDREEKWFFYDPLA